MSPIIIHIHFLNEGRLIATGPENRTVGIVEHFSHDARPLSVSAFRNAVTELQ